MYTAVVRQAQLAEGAAITASVQGVEVLLACVAGHYFAVAAHCTHAGQNLAPGRLDDFEIMCPAHGARFDIRTGHCTAAPAMNTEPSKA